MKIVCRRDALLSACQLVATAVAARTTKPILAGIKAIAQQDSLVLMATDLEIGVRYELRGVKTDRAGSAWFAPNRFLSILKESGDDELTIDVGTETTLIRLASGRYEIPNGEPDEFPDIPEFDAGGTHHEIAAGKLRTMIKRTAFAADKRESTRFAVSGVLWEVEAGLARLVATDTRRLALCEAPALVFGDVAELKGRSHLIPLKALSLVERNLTDDGELVRIVLKENEAMFQTERAMIHTRLVEGRFPPYRNIIPKKGDIRIELAVSEFHSRVRQAAIMTDEETKRVDFQFESGKVTLRARGQETGASEISMPLTYDHAELKIAFDPSYLSEMFRSIDGEPSAILEMTDGTRPAVFRIGEHYLYLVMPLT